MRGRNWYIKLVLILLFEVLTMGFTAIITKFTTFTGPSLLVQSFFGMVVAYLVIRIYDYYGSKTNVHAEGELQQLTDAALMRYRVQEHDRSRN